MARNICNGQRTTDNGPSTTDNMQSSPAPNNPHGEPVLWCSGLTKDFTDIWGRPTVRSVENLNLTVRKGEIFGLLGPNGAGKTTTIKLVLGLIFPTAGTIRVLGADPRDVQAKQKIGYLPEESYLHRFLNAEETLDFYGRLFDLPAEVRRERAAKLIERVGLTHARKRPLKEYSKGMVRRVGLAQCLINDPELILLDEPTSGMDPILSREIKDLILDLKAQGKTVLLSSHLLGDVEDLCDRIAMLYRGRLQLEGKVSDLLEMGDVTEVAIRNLDDTSLAVVKAEVQSKGGEVLDAHRRRQRLETLFMQVVQREREKQDGATGGRGDGAKQR
ncbi:MAG TPA: ABC transporter ATP-binding protein [Planctomycetota bacterium]|jgi:ABC-2 type transport system ATP-binding protein